MLFVGTSIIHPSTEGVFLLCNILDLLIYSYYDIIVCFQNFPEYSTNSVLHADLLAERQDRALDIPSALVNCNLGILLI